MEPIHLTLRPEQKYQTIEGFGASGAWWAQLVGGWPEPTRQEIIKLLYSKTEGLGMTTYRYNLGGGSKESGKGNYWCPRRRASDFLKPDGSCDWSRDAEAVWCLKEAARNGADEIILFVNSPPERWTVSGMAQAKIPFKANLRRKHEVDFTRYVLDAAEHFLAEGIPVRFISPINEPFGPWSAKLSGQEGCHYWPRGVRRVMRLFAREMDKRSALDGVLLSGAENNNLRIMNKTYTRAVMNDPAIRGRLDGIDIHGYNDIPLLKNLKGAKRRFRGYMDKKYPGEKIRMTEWTEMRGGRDCGMESALVLANEVFEDLSVSNAVSWQLWIAVSEYDFCDGLIYIDAEQQTFDIPKRYYAFGNFTRFIPRGSVRVAIENPSDAMDALAFITPEGKHVAVLRNPGEELLISLGKGAAEMYTTDETRNLAQEKVDLKELALSARSVCTITW